MKRVAPPAAGNANKLRAVPSASLSRPVVSRPVVSRAPASTPQSSSVRGGLISRAGAAAPTSSASRSATLQRATPSNNVSTAARSCGVLGSRPVVSRPGAAAGQQQRVTPAAQRPAPSAVNRPGGSILSRPGASLANRPGAALPSSASRLGPSLVNRASTAVNRASTAVGSRPAVPVRVPPSGRPEAPKTTVLPRGNVATLNRANSTSSLLTKPGARSITPGQQAPRMVPQPSRAVSVPARSIAGASMASASRVKPGQPMVRQLGSSTSLPQQETPSYGRPAIGPGGKPVNFIVRQQPEPPKARRMPLILSDEKAVIGTPEGETRWVCGKCTRLNRNLRKVCGREHCGGIAPLNVKQVVVDCANVGCRYGENHSIRPPPGQMVDRERHKKFHWNGVRNTVKHYKKMGLIVSLVSKENWPAPMPADLEPYSCTVPRVDGDHENDDYFVLKIAYQKNCFYVTNDNFRNWKEEVEDPMMAKWFLGTKRLLHVSYVFDNCGDFVPRHDAQLQWADDDSNASSPRNSASPGRNRSPVANLADVASDEEPPAIIIRSAPIKTRCAPVKSRAVPPGEKAASTPISFNAMNAAVPKSKGMGKGAAPPPRQMPKPGMRRPLPTTPKSNGIPSPASWGSDLEYDFDSIGATSSQPSGQSGEVIVIEDTTSMSGGENDDLEIDGAEGEDEVDLVFDGEGDDYVLEPDDNDEDEDELELDGEDTEDSIDIDIDGGAEEEGAQKTQKRKSPPKRNSPSPPKQRRMQVGSGNRNNDGDDLELEIDDGALEDGADGNCEDLELEDDAAGEGSDQFELELDIDG